MTRPRLLAPNQDLREAVAAAIAYASQCKEDADVWRSHNPAGFKIMPTSCRERCRRNGMRLCYSATGKGGLFVHQGVPSFDELFNSEE